MKHVLALTFFLSPVAALAQPVGKPTEGLPPAPITLSAQELNDIVTTLRQSGLFVQQADGSMQPYVGNGAAKVIQLLATKEAAAAHDLAEATAAKAKEEEKKADGEKPPRPPHRPDGAERTEPLRDGEHHTEPAK
jgi:hypothetical protein